jgi:hypothetical protein
VSANDFDAAQFFILKCDTVTEPNLDCGNSITAAADDNQDT